MSYITITSKDSKEILRISRDGIWVDPTIEPTITASQVLNFMDGYIKTLCQFVWNDAIDACIHHLEYGSSSILELKK